MILGNPYPNTYPNVRYNCPVCGENRGRFYIYEGTNPKKKGKYICFNCGVQGTYKKEASYHEIEKLAFNREVTEIEEEVLPPIDFKFAEMPYEALEYVKSRGFDGSTLKVSTNLAYAERIAFNVLSFDSEAVFYGFRDYTERQIPKVLFPKSTHLNVANKRECLMIHPTRGLKPDDIPVITEGDFGIWSIDSGKYVGVGTMGRFISKAQAKYLADRYQTVYYMPDNEVIKSEINTNINTLALAGVENIYVYDKSQYVGKNDDPNDILLREGKDWFNPRSFRCKLI